jgi:peptide/nickel transport system substrate-binding protein
LRRAGERITSMAAQNLPANRAFGDITVDLLQRLGMNLDFAALDWAQSSLAEARKRRHVRAAGIFIL